MTSAGGATLVTVDDVRRLCLSLPRTTEHLIRDRVKFRVKQLVYVSFSRDETLMGFAFPRELRAGLVEAEPDKFRMPATSDLRYQWVVAVLAALDEAEMTELVTDAWTMCVPKYVAREYFASQETGQAP
jgi:hypothetical protein